MPQLCAPCGHISDMDGDCSSPYYGTLLLGALSYILARERRVGTTPEVVKHLVVAFVVIFVSKAIGYWVSRQVAA